MKHLYEPAGDTIRLPRPPKVVTHHRGYNVWIDDVAATDLELEPGMKPEPTDPYNSAQPHIDHWRNHRPR